MSQVAPRSRPGVRDLRLASSPDHHVLPVCRRWLSDHDEALWRDAERTSVFSEVDPNQKERIILALKKTGHVVGFLGDGVNDAPAMHAADTSLSVESAVDVAREAATSCCSSATSMRSGAVWRHSL